MSAAYQRYAEVVEQMSMHHAGIETGKWLNKLEALQFEGETFAAFYKDSLVVRQSTTSGMRPNGIREFVPPGRERVMLGWVMVDFSRSRDWQRLVELAFKDARG